MVAHRALWSSSLLTPKLEPTVGGAVVAQARAQDGWLVGLVFGLEALNLV